MKICAKESKVLNVPKTKRYFDKESHQYTHFFFLTFAVHMISKSKETNLEHLRQHFFNIS